ncbi:DUF1801 domain-containing protein [Candidatus Woesearchaeota archaeon]|nr:DUF1801 domain-containing protein [Candidatus Woesearchaeota archaeon]
MKAGPIPKTIDEYLKPLAPEVKTTLQKLRKTIKAAAPKAEEGISYQMPCYKYYGQLVYFAAFKNHCSLFAGRKLLTTLSKELEKFDVKGSTIHFTPEKPLPAVLVTKIVKLRMKENEARSKK